MRRARRNLTQQHEDKYQGAPHTFVINRGRVGKTVRELMMDIRRVMEPFTASKLKVTE